MAMNKAESYEADGVIGLFAFAVILYVLPLTYGLIKDGLEGGQSWCIIPFVGWLIEPIIVLADGYGRKLGDRAANTQVIEKLYYR